MARKIKNGDLLWSKEFQCFYIVAEISTGMHEQMGAKHWKVKLTKSSPDYGEVVVCGNGCEQTLEAFDASMKVGKYVYVCNLANVLNKMKEGDKFKALVANSGS